MGRYVFVVQIYCFLFHIAYSGTVPTDRLPGAQKFLSFRIYSIYQSQNGTEFTMLVFHFYILHIIFAIRPSMGLLVI
jgi:hypothetical protein